MALTQSKRFYLHLSKYGNRDLFPVLGNNFQNILSVVHYSGKPAPTSKLSKAMELHMQKAEKYDKFMKQQLQEYELGKKFLANMMGKKQQNMTEKEVDEAIEYLFPSALYVPKSRPLMKPPDVVFAKQKEAVFDASGRPFHFLFYTCKPNFSQLLHDAAAQLEKLNGISLAKFVPPKPLCMLGGRWLTKAELEAIYMEKLYDIDYEKFVVLFDRLLNHPYALTIESFIRKYWKAEGQSVEMIIPKPVSEDNDVKVFTAKGLKKKTSIAEVTIRYPGTGKIKINDLGLDYFQNLERRQQVGLGVEKLKNLIKMSVLFFGFTRTKKDRKKQQVDVKIMQMSRLVTHIVEFLTIAATVVCPPSRRPQLAFAPSLLCRLRYLFSLRF